VSFCFRDRVANRRSTSVNELFLATQDLELLLEPGGFRSIQGWGERFAIVDASCVSRAFVNRIDHRLEGQGNVGIGSRKRDRRIGQRPSKVRCPDPTMLGFPRWGDQQRINSSNYCE
jgi:hypothetical protein